MWKLSAKEVTKYNPKNRDEKGNYIIDEWIDYTDVGKKFEGVIFLLSDYKIIEDRYVNAVKFLFEYYNCNKIQLVSKKIFPEEDLEWLKDKDLEIFYSELLTLRTINIDDIDKVVKLILRGAFYAELHGKKDRRVSVRFSYDYYMYLNFPENEHIIRYIENYFGLYVR